MAGDWIPAPYRGTGQALRRNDGVRMALVLRGGFETRPYGVEDEGLFAEGAAAVDDVEADDNADGQDCDD